MLLGESNVSFVHDAGAAPTRSSKRLWLPVFPVLLEDERSSGAGGVFSVVASLIQPKEADIMARARKYGNAAKKSVKSALHRAKAGTLKSGKGKHPKVKSRKQAIAIGLSEARKRGAKVPKKSRKAA
jgi:hypothetical protein